MQVAEAFEIEQYLNNHLAHVLRGTNKMDMFALVGDHMKDKSLKRS